MQIAFFAPHYAAASVACLSLSCILYLSAKWLVSGGGYFSVKCVFWFSLQTLLESFIVPGRIQGDTIVNRCQPTLNFLYTFE